MVLKSSDQVCYRTPLYWNLSDTFLMISPGLWACGAEITEVKYHFHPVILRVHAINMIYDHWCHPCSLGWSDAVRFLHCKITLLPPSMLYSLEGSLHAELALKKRGVIILYINYLDWSTYINYLEFLCMGDVCFLPHLLIYSIIYLYISGLVDISFVCWVIIQHYFIV